MTSTFNGAALVAQADIDTPLGPLRALATARGLAGLWFDDCKHHPGRFDAPLDPDNLHIAAARRWRPRSMRCVHCPASASGRCN